jgi:hypothetical protein
MTQHTTQTVTYVLVNSAGQNLARQLEAVGPVDWVFEEKVSGGSRADRAALAERIRSVRDVDNVRVSAMDRLARSLRDRPVLDWRLGVGFQGVGCGALGLNTRRPRSPIARPTRLPARTSESQWAPTWSLE